MDEHPLFPMIADIKQDIGKVIQGQENLGKYIETVSNDQKELVKKHDEHVQDDMAHGFRTMKRTLAAVGGVITFVITCVLSLFEFLVHKK